MLVYAHREDTAQHERALAWLDELTQASGPFGLGAIVAAGFVRVVTGKTVFAAKPSTISDATAFIDEVLSADNCRWLVPGAEHWKIYSRLCLASRSAGKHAADAQHAAVAIENGCTLASADGDFARFEDHGLSWRHLAF